MPSSCWGITSASSPDWRLREGTRWRPLSLFGGHQPSDRSDQHSANARRRQLAHPMRSWFAAQPWSRNYGDAPGTSKTVRKRLIATRDRSRSAARSPQNQALCLEPRMIALEFGRTYPGSFSASTAFIVPNVAQGLSANPSANAWMIASLRSIRGVRGEHGLAVLPEISSRGSPRRLEEGAAPASRCPNRHQRDSPTSRARCGAWRRLSRAACRPALAAVGREAGAPLDV